MNDKQILENNVCIDFVSSIGEVFTEKDNLQIVKNIVVPIINKFSSIIRCNCLLFQFSTSSFSFI